MNDIGVRGGEDDICRDEDGGVAHGGHSTRAETASTDYGRRWRDGHRDDIERQRLIRPRSNWYRLNDRTFE